MKLLKITLLACALASCATTNSPSATQADQSSKTKPSKKQMKTSYEFVKANVNFTEDKHIGGRTAIAPEIKYKDPDRNKWSDGYVFYKLIGIDVGRSGADTINFSDVQIRMHQTVTGDWPFYSSAYTEGKKLGFTKVDSDVSCLGGACYKKEIFGVDMTIEQLKAVSETTSFSFKVIGKGNSTVIEIPQSYITGFIAAIDAKEGPKTN